MRIVLKGQDGSVAIMTLVDGADKEEAVGKFKASHVDGFYVDYFEVDEAHLPSDREFRDAWTCVSNKVVVDESKAQQIHLAHIRRVRNLELDMLDKEMLRHLASPEKLKEIEDKKQVLRDLPQHITGLEWPSLLLEKK